MQRAPDVRIRDAGERAAGAARAEQPVGAVAGELLVPELLPLGHVLREQLCREQTLDHVVVAGVALAPREPDRAGDGVRLEDRAHSVLRQPEPVLRLAALALEVGRAERPIRAEPLEYPLRDGGVVRQRRGVEPRSLAACVDAVPGELARRDERQRLVGRLEDLAALVQRHRTRQARSPRRARAASGRGSGLRPRSGRTGSSRACGSPPAPRRGLPSRDRAGARKCRATR